MSDLPSSLLILNGFVVLLLGLLCGAPLGKSINANRAEEVIRAWRVAHSSLVDGGVMLLAIAAVLSHLALTQGSRLLVSILLSGSVYAFAYALVAGARSGYRGLRKEGNTSARVVYYANMVGAALSIMALGLLVYGAAVSLAGKILAT